MTGPRAPETCPYCGGPLPSRPFSKLRLQHGLTMRELADKAGLSASAVMRFEHGQELTVGTAMKLARALGMTLDELVASREGAS